MMCCLLLPLPNAAREPVPSEILIKQQSAAVDPDPTVRTNATNPLEMPGTAFKAH